MPTSEKKNTSKNTTGHRDRAFGKIVKSASLKLAARLAEENKCGQSSEKKDSSMGRLPPPPKDDTLDTVPDHRIKVDFDGKRTKSANGNDDVVVIETAEIAALRLKLLEMEKNNEEQFIANFIANAERHMEVITSKRFLASAKLHATRTDFLFFNN
ncbi:hypothetical protein ACOME3_009433 [Neoechinorhynchus agilis]